VAAASAADLVIASVGESAAMSGEARSRSRIGLPGVQEELLQALHATGKPLVVLVNAGRPLIFNWAAEHADAVLYTWWLGSEAGHAIADVLSGDHNPAARLPMSFPRHEGRSRSTTTTSAPAARARPRPRCPGRVATSTWMPHPPTPLATA
jgi:beta-glucosidase